MSLIEKLQKIEALIEGTSSEGEKQAAQLAKERITSQLEKQKEDIEVEFKYTFSSYWKKRLFMCLCQKYGYSTYRYYRQRYTTACIRVSEKFLNETIHPEFLRYSKLFEELVEDLMQDLTNQIHKTKEDETIVANELEFTGMYTTRK